MDFKEFKAVLNSVQEELRAEEKLKANDLMLADVLALNGPMYGEASTKLFLHCENDPLLFYITFTDLLRKNQACLEEKRKMEKELEEKFQMSKIRELMKIFERLLPRV
jgi:hypothetical protein